MNEGWLEGRYYRVVNGNWSVAVDNDDISASYDAEAETDPPYAGAMVSCERPLATREPPQWYVDARKGVWVIALEPDAPVDRLDYIMEEVRGDHDSAQSARVVLGSIGHHLERGYEVRDGANGTLELHVDHWFDSLIAIARPV